MHLHFRPQTAGKVIVRVVHQKCFSYDFVTTPETFFDCFFICTPKLSFWQVGKSIQKQYIFCMAQLQISLIVICRIENKFQQQCIFCMAQLEISWIVICESRVP